MALDTSKGKILSHHGTTVATFRGRTFLNMPWLQQLLKGACFSRPAMAIATCKVQIFSQHSTSNENIVAKRGMTLATSKGRFYLDMASCRNPQII